MKGDYVDTATQMANGLCQVLPFPQETSCTTDSAPSAFKHGMFLNNRPHRQFRASWSFLSVERSSPAAITASVYHDYLRPAYYLRN